MIVIRDSGERIVLSNSSGMIPLADLLSINRDEQRLVWVEHKDGTYDASCTGWATAWLRLDGVDADADIVFMPLADYVCNYACFAPADRYGVTYACYNHRPMESELPWFKKECAGAVEVEQSNEQLPS